MIQTTGQENLTLVVGTTPDYIDWIRTAAPGRALFLTDPELRHRAKEAPPAIKEEILFNINDYDKLINVIDEHMGTWNLSLNGIACFDCESMDLAARLAERYSLPYASPEAVKLCRSKYLSKIAWAQSGLACPKTDKVRSPEDAAFFFRNTGGRTVLKPLAGSGSEHVYLCETEEECRASYALIHAALQARQGHRLYHSPEPASELIVAEEFIQGTEYSCDFLVDHGQTALIRLTKKIRALNRPFGTIQGYVLCDPAHEGIDPDEFLGMLGQCANALKIDRSICMLDFMVQDGKIVLLELAPRPGGDCLPQLLLHAHGIDILKLTLDFAAQGRGLPSSPRTGTVSRFMGIRLLANHAGAVKEIDASDLKDDSRVLAVGIAKEPGQKVVMPPDDYDSWILGHIVARLTPGKDPESELAELLGKIQAIIC